MKILITIFIGIVALAWLVFAWSILQALLWHAWDKAAFFMVLSYYLRQIAGDASMGARQRIDEDFEDEYDENYDI